MPRIRIATALIVIGSASGALFGCKQEAAKPKPAKTAEPAVAPPAPPSPDSEAKRIFNTRCVVCHGTEGHGDGPGAAALNPKPRAFGDANWQKSADDARLAKVIVQGGAAVGLSPGMAPNPDLEGKPEVVASLIKIVRSFNK